MSEIVGDTVEYIGEYDPYDDDRFYPPPGTRGTLLSEGKSSSLVRWDDGSTSDNGVWYVANDDFRIIE